jgi:Tol biopolymer transport system component
MSFSLREAAVVAATLALSCGTSGTQPGGDGGGDVVQPPPTYTNVVVDPPDVTLNVPVAGSVTQDYKAYADTNGQTHVDVTSSCAFTLANTTLGTFTGATFTSAALGGSTQVTATCGGAKGTGKLTLVLSGWVLGPGAPANAPTIFQTATVGTDANRTPTIQYPLDEAVAPLNIPPIDTQWTVAQNDLFHMTWKSPHLAMEMYTTTADAEFAADVWKAVATSGQGDAISVVVEGLQQAQPATKFASATVTLNMSHDIIDNTAIYWWASSQGSLLTQTFGQTNAPTSVKAGCTSCHSLSRSGSRIGYSRCVGNNCGNLYGGFMRFDTTNKVWVDTLNADGMTLHGSYSTFSPVGYPFPDDKSSVALFAMASCNLSLFDPDTGAAVASNVDTVSTHDNGQSTRCATMPDWAPDGKSVIFASTPNQGQWIDVSSSAIAKMTYDYSNATHTFGEPSFLVRNPITLGSGTYDNFFFPSWSPDGTYVVFDAARAAWRNFTVAGSPGQRLMMTDASGSWTVDLANINGPGDLDTTWPHWAPTNSADYYWVVYSSERDYGHKLTKSNTASACVANGVQQCKQIWIGAISKATLTAKSPPDDPSAPPVWMPGQDIGADNISPYWTLPTSAIPQ